MASADVWSVLPKKTCPMSSAVIPDSASAARAAKMPSCVAVSSLSEPPKVPNPVRFPERKTTSVLCS